MRRTQKGPYALQSPRNAVNALLPFTKKHHQVDSGRPISNQDAESLRREINLLKLRLQQETKEKQDLEVKIKILGNRLKTDFETKVTEVTPAGNALRVARAQRKANYPNNKTIIPELYEKLRDLEEQFRDKEQELRKMQMSSQQSNHMEMKLMLFEYYQETQRLRKKIQTHDVGHKSKKIRRKRRSKRKKDKQQLTTPYGTVSLPTIYITDSGAPTYVRPASGLSYTNGQRAGNGSGAHSQTPRPVVGSGANPLQDLIRSRKQGTPGVKPNSTRKSPHGSAPPGSGRPTQFKRPPRYHTFEEVDGAALQIQAVFHGHIVRKDLRTRRRAGTAINRCARGHMARKKYKMMREKKAATNINRCARGYLARRKIQREHDAAVKLQCMYRSHHARVVVEGMRRDHAATIIQRNVRRWKILYQEKLDRAARIITRAFRCYGPIKLLKNMKIAAVTINRNAMRFLRKQAKGRRLSVKWNSIIRRYKLHVYLEEQRIQRENEAAVKLQSVFRMRLARKEYLIQYQAYIERLERENAAMEEADKWSRDAALWAESERLRIEREKLEQEERMRRGEAAVVTLQARFRGMKGRQLASEMAAEKRRVEEEKRKIEEERLRVEKLREDSAVKLQKTIRGSKSKRSFTRFKRAATWVQSQIRRQIAMQKVKELTKEKWRLFSELSSDWAARDLHWEDQDEIAHLSAEQTTTTAEVDKAADDGLSVEFKYQWDAEGGAQFIREDGNLDVGNDSDAIDPFV